MVNMKCKTKKIFGANANVRETRHPEIGPKTRPYSCHMGQRKSLFLLEHCCSSPL